MCVYATKRIPEIGFLKKGVLENGAQKNIEKMVGEKHVINVRVPIV